MGPGSGPGLGFGIADFAIHITISLNILIDWMPKFALHTRHNPTRQDIHFLQPGHNFEVPEIGDLR